MQLSRRARAPGAKKRGFLTTGAEIVKKETPLGLYKGLGAVVTGIVPKMAIRFTSFEAYKKLLANKETGIVSGQATFLGELFSLFCYKNLPLSSWLTSKTWSNYTIFQSKC
jgi:solute carrier family 25 citrate transporter 1